MSRKLYFQISTSELFGTFKRIPLLIYQHRAETFQKVLKLIFTPFSPLENPLIIIIEGPSCPSATSIGRLERGRGYGEKSTFTHTHFTLNIYSYTYMYIIIITCTHVSVAEIIIHILSVIPTVCCSQQSAWYLLSSRVQLYLRRIVINNTVHETRHMCTKSASRFFFHHT